MGLAWMTCHKLRRWCTHGVGHIQGVRVTGFGKGRNRGRRLEGGGGLGLGVRVPFPVFTACAGESLLGLGKCHAHTSADSG